MEKSHCQKAQYRYYSVKMDSLDLPVSRGLPAHIVVFARLPLVQKVEGELPDNYEVSPQALRHTRLSLVYHYGS